MNKIITKKNGENLLHVDGYRPKKMNTMYIYTTKSDRENKRYKIGGTKLSAEERVNQQDSTSNSEELELIYSVQTTLWDRTIGNKKGVHHFLELKGFYKTRTDKDREWFGDFDSDEHVILEVSKVISENDKKGLDVYIPYFFKGVLKDRFFEFLVEALNNGEVDIDFALEMAARSGKTTFIISELMKDLFYKYDYKVAILPTYWLSAISSFIKDLYKYKGFTDYIYYVDKDDDLQEVLNTYYDKKLIVVEKSLHKNDWELEFKPVLDLPKRDKVAFMDEADFGTWRTNQKEDIKKLDCHVNVHLTGSNIEKVVSSLDNVGDRIIRFSYTDILMMFNGEHPWLKDMKFSEILKIRNSLRGIVTPHFYKLILDTFIDKNNSVPDEYKTKWSKLLADVDQSKEQLETLIRSLYGLYVDNNVNFINLEVDLPLEVSMIFANTKNKPEQEKFKVLLEKILGERYDIILLNSTKSSNKEAEDKVSKEIAKAKRNNKRVIILTKDMGSRSFGISEVDTIFLLFDGGDVGVVSQKISRVLTPGKTYNGEKKSVGNVVSLSLDPNRDSSPVDEYILKESEKVEEEDLNESIKKVLRSINLFSNETGLIKSLDTDEYYNELIESSSLLSVGASAVKTYNVPEDVDLDGVKIYKLSRKKQKGIDRSKVVTYEQDGEVVTDSEEIKKIEKDIYNQLRSIVYKTTDFSEINNIESDNYIEMMKNIKNKGYDSEVKYDVGLGCDDIIKLCESDSIPVKLMNTILTSYNRLENSLNKA